MSIKNLMQQQAVIYNKTGYNKFGRDVDGSGTTTSCRFQDKSQFLTMPNQQVVQLVGIFYFPPEVTISPEDRVVFNSLSYKVFSVNSSIDGRGTNRITKVSVTKWQT